MGCMNQQPLWALVSIWKHLDSAVIIFLSFKSEIKMLTVAEKLLCWRVQAVFRKPSADTGWGSGKSKSLMCSSGLWSPPVFPGWSSAEFCVLWLRLTWFSISTLQSAITSWTLYWRPQTGLWRFSIHSVFWPHCYLQRVMWMLAWGVTGNFGHTFLHLFHLFLCHIFCRLEQNNIKKCSPQW